MKHINSGHSLLDLRLSFFFKSGCDQNISKRFTANDLDREKTFWILCSVDGPYGRKVRSSRVFAISVLIVTMLAGPSNFKAPAHW